MTFRLIEAKRAQYPVSLLCRVLQVSRSGFYAWISRPPSARATEEDAELTETIEKIHAGSKGLYGAPPSSIPQPPPRST